MDRTVKLCASEYLTGNDNMLTSALQGTLKLARLSQLGLSAVQLTINKLETPGAVPKTLYLCPCPVT